MEGKRRWGSRGGRIGGGCAGIGHGGCPSGVIFVCGGGVFPEPRGSQPRWQVTGDWGRIHSVPSGALFYSGDPRVRKYRSLSICKQSLKGHGANRSRQLRAIRGCSWWLSLGKPVALMFWISTAQRFDSEKGPAELSGFGVLVSFPPCLLASP